MQRLLWAGLTAGPPRLRAAAARGLATQGPPGGKGDGGAPKRTGFKAREDGSGDVARGLATQGPGSWGKGRGAKRAVCKVRKDSSGGVAETDEKLTALLRSVKRISLIKDFAEKAAARRDLADLCVSYMRDVHELSPRALTFVLGSTLHLKPPQPEGSWAPYVDATVKQALASDDFPLLVDDKHLVKAFSAIQTWASEDTWWDLHERIEAELASGKVSMTPRLAHILGSSKFELNGLLTESRLLEMVGDTEAFKGLGVEEVTGVTCRFIDTLPNTRVANAGLTSLVEIAAQHLLQAFPSPRLTAEYIRVLVAKYYRDHKYPGWCASTAMDNLDIRLYFDSSVFSDHLCAKTLWLCSTNINKLLNPSRRENIQHRKAFLQSLCREFETRSSLVSKGPRTLTQFLGQFYHLNKVLNVPDNKFLARYLDRTVAAALERPEPLDNGSIISLLTALKLNRFSIKGDPRVELLFDQVIFPNIGISDVSDSFDPGISTENVLFLADIMLYCTTGEHLQRVFDALLRTLAVRNEDWSTISIRSINTIGKYLYAPSAKQITQTSPYYHSVRVKLRDGFLNYLHSKPQELLTDKSQLPFLFRTISLLEEKQLVDAFKDFLIINIKYFGSDELLQYAEFVDNDIIETELLARNMGDIPSVDAKITFLNSLDLLSSNNSSDNKTSLRRTYESLIQRFHKDDLAVNLEKLDSLPIKTLGLLSRLADSRGWGETLTLVTDEILNRVVQSSTLSLEKDILGIKPRLSKEIPESDFTRALAELASASPPRLTVNALVSLLPDAVNENLRNSILDGIIRGLDINTPGRAMAAIKLFSVIPAADGQSEDELESNLPDRHQSFSPDAIAISKVNTVLDMAGKEVLKSLTERTCSFPTGMLISALFALRAIRSQQNHRKLYMDYTVETDLVVSLADAICEEISCIKIGDLVGIVGVFESFNLPETRTRTDRMLRVIWQGKEDLDIPRLFELCRFLRDPADRGPIVDLILTRSREDISSSDLAKIIRSLNRTNGSVPRSDELYDYIATNATRLLPQTDFKALIRIARILSLHHMTVVVGIGNNAQSKLASDAKLRFFDELENRIIQTNLALTVMSTEDWVRCITSFSQINHTSNPTLYVHALRYIERGVSELSEHSVMVLMNILNRRDVVEMAMTNAPLFDTIGELCRNLLKSFKTGKKALSCFTLDDINVISKVFDTFLDPSHKPSRGWFS